MGVFGLMKNSSNKRSIDGSDVLILVGLGALGVGIGLMHIPAALITVGGILLAIGLFSSLPAKNK